MRNSPDTSWRVWAVACVPQISQRSEIGKARGLAEALRGWRGGGVAG